MSNKTPYDFASFLFFISSLPLLFLAKLPSLQVHYLLLVLLLFITTLSVFVPQFWIRLLGMLLAGFLWSTMSASNYISSIEPYIDQTLTIEGEIKSINVFSGLGEEIHYRYVDVEIEKINQRKLNHVLNIAILWKESTMPFAGERWQWEIKTKAVHTYLNEGGFDSQRFAIANKNILRASYKNAILIDKNRNLRQSIVDKTLNYINLFSYGDIMLALIFGERSILAQSHKLVMFQTGIAHLMAISGMHILFIAYFGNKLMKGLQLLFPIRLIYYQIPPFFGVCCAIFYAWLSGFNPPVIRAILALCLWFVFKHQSISLTSWQIINRIIAILLFFDPLMILSESFWLSCYAVICLVFIAQFFSSFKKNGNQPHYLIQLIRLQFFLTCLLLPMQLFIFNGIALSSILANLVAIPVVSLITLPCVLLMLLMSLLDYSYLAIWFGLMAENSLSWLFTILRPLSEYWIDIPHQYYLFSVVGWLMIIIWKMANVHRNFMTLLFLFSLLIIPIIRKQDENWRVDMLDVGHGLAIVISQGKSAILYDTGAKWQNSSAAERIIIPFLTWHNLSVEGIIISHQHNDHIGGLDSLKKHFPNAWLMSSSMALDNQYPCISGEKLIWKKLQLTVLWPEKLHQSALNSASCVVKISDGKQGILLTGDLERSQEEELVLMQKEGLFSTILQMPHHGSNTSSYYAFLSYVNPEVSLGSVSRYNLWNLPSDKALSRYDDLNIDYYLTKNSGQISIFFYDENWTLKRMRYEIRPRWYHDWFGDFIN